MVLNYPGVGWLVVYETTTISFVLERAIGWMVPRRMGSGHGAMTEKGAWEKMLEGGMVASMASGAKESEMLELQIVSSWEDVLEYLHEREVW